MTNGEFQSARTEPEGLASAFDVRMQCAQEVDSALNEYVTRASFGAGPAYDPQTIAAILERNIALAATRPYSPEEADEYLGTVERYFDHLVTAPAMPTRSIIRGCLQAAEAGSQRAFAMLSGMLEAERLSVQAREPFALPHDPEAHTLIRGDLLREVISMCEMRDIPATGWIDNYAASRNWHWSLRIGHYGTLVKKPELQELYEPSLNETALELIDAHLYTKGTAYEYTHEALERATYPEVRHRLLAHFLTLSPEKPLSEESLGGLFAVGHIALNDPQSSNDTLIVNQLKQRIESYMTEAWQSDVIASPIDTIKKYLAWHIRLLEHEGSDTETLISMIPVYAKELFEKLPDSLASTSDTPANSLSASNQIARHQACDELLKSYATKNAAKDDFKTAKKYWDAITDPVEQKAAMLGLLYQASTIDQLDTIAPPEGDTILDHELQLAFAFERMWLADVHDIDEFQQNGKLAAVTINDGLKSLKLRYIRDVQATLTAYSRPLGILFTRQVIDLLRAAGQPYSELRQLSEALIANGDQAEPRQAYEDIHRSSPNPSVRIRALARLALVCRPPAD